ncbi:NAD(P)H-quinone oxidoreductase [Sphingomicrobium aestuariivivum]|uniref:NAD(P)H-quinone oxidoreductase n=1 Tax=Sphingomicrobium aestuariivivum TaxID=1582356 RepID=UPI001FD6F996|nr:NAD(P)H-quinone oxidoreductase [Sphingomicrobium aestuariivivum]MCJ8191799.1 NAD(P)H-quinone oxidoreductase [Sphingomicrobium aestuariivivum]
MASDLPETMRCVTSPEPGRLELVERPLPQPGPGELLVRVAAAGVNRPDLLQVKGVYPPPEGASDVLGLELAGEVVAAGEGCDTPLGARVCGLVAGGAYAEYCLLPEGTALPVPETLRMEEAAAMPETLFTVWTNLFERGFAAEGDIALVHGGTSGIGTMAIKLCRLFGVTIIVTCGSEEKVEAALDAGAHAAINYNTEDFVDRVKDITEGRGVDIVLDMVGGDYVARNISCMADEGRHVSIAFQRGAEASISIVQIMRRRLTLTGSTLRARSLRFKTMVADELRAHVWNFVEGGRLRPVMDERFPLSDVEAAHARMAAGEHVGKIVLEP